MDALLDQYLEKTGNNKKRRKLTLNELYFMWRRVLLERTIRILEYEIIEKPSDDFYIPPQRELMLPLIFNGYAGVTDSKTQKGLLYVGYGGMSGVTDYPDIFKKLTYSTPLQSGYKEIGKDATIIMCNSLMMPLWPIINRYALLLAHADLSLQAVLINTRTTGIIAASDESQAQLVKTWYNGLVDGNTIAVVDKDDANSLLNSEGLRFISTQYPSSSSIRDFVQVHNDLITDFMEQIGIKKPGDKKERMNVDEVNSSNGYLMNNVEDMLYCQQEAWDNEYNRSGVKVKVKLNNVPGETSEQEEVKYDGDN